MPEDGKKDLSSIIPDQLQKNTMSTVENAFTDGKKMSLSPFVQGFLLGGICGRFPVGYFAVAAAGLLSGLYLEENFHLPDIKSEIVRFLPKEKKKDD